MEISGKYYYCNKVYLNPMYCVSGRCDYKVKRMAQMKLISIGGGGFTHSSHPDLDTFCLRHTVPNPRIGFVGVASGDNQTKINQFYQHFEHCGATLDHLPLTACDTLVAQWLESVDLVYFGGGNTARMIEHFETNGWSVPLMQAARRGVTMAGVSAGGVFWFEWCLSNAKGNGLQPLRGLGLLRGGICPHYSSEPLRQSSLRAAVRENTMPTSYAIDDGAAMVFGADTVIDLCSAAPGAGCYQISGGQETTHQTRAVSLGDRHLGLLD